MSADNDRERPVIAQGVILALAAALAFGLSTPVVQRAGASAGSFVTAFLLYAGATLGTAPFLIKLSEAPLSSRELPRVLLIAVLGAAIAPSLFAWGLRRSSAASASILLSTEAAFTALLAWAFYRESIGRRVTLAIVLMLVAGGAIVFRTSALGLSSGSAIGLFALVGAVLAWSLDNTLARALADHDVAQVVVAKAGLGAAITLAPSAIMRDAWPSSGATVVLLVCGVCGYGLSLRLYMLAQRRIGAVRTASVFAVAPFLGALLAWLLGDRAGTPMLASAAVLFGAASWLHLSERHRHAHVHEATRHDHFHRHDDGHHGHVHDVYPDGEHAHPHAHDRIDHAHEHGEDIHHRHGAPIVKTPGRREHLSYRLALTGIVVVIFK